MGKRNRGLLNYSDPITTEIALNYSNCFHTTETPKVPIGNSRGKLPSTFLILYPV